MRRPRVQAPWQVDQRKRGSARSTSMFASPERTTNQVIIVISYPRSKMSALGHKQTYAVQNGRSALPPKADICSAQAHVCFGPKADITPPIRSPRWHARAVLTRLHSVDAERGLYRLRCTHRCPTSLASIPHRQLTLSARQGWCISIRPPKVS